MFSINYVNLVFTNQLYDPEITGTGKGGSSIWGGHFDDEFHESVKVWMH